MGEYRLAHLLKLLCSKVYNVAAGADFVRGHWIVISGVGEGGLGVGLMI